VMGHYIFLIHSVRLNKQCTLIIKLKCFPIYACNIFFFVVTLETVSSHSSFTAHGPRSEPLFPAENIQKHATRTYGSNLLIYLCIHSIPGTDTKCINSVHMGSHFYVSRRIPAVLYWRLCNS